MAIVKIHFRKNAKRVIDYVQRDMEDDDVSKAHRTTLEMATADFKAVQQMHNMKGDNECVHIVQSWHPKEKNLLTPDEFNEMGKSLAEQYFPGHQFIVVTHTGTENIHNHIVVNAVNIDTGKKIEPKKKHLYKLRDLSDEIIADKGLSIVNGLAKEREARMPQNVQQMMRFNKHSWLFETKQKADFVRQFATSYDEYASSLGTLGITVQVEPKNITYFYPGRSKGKRGSKLGKPYDKPGLEKTFRENDEKFRENPQLRQEFSKAFGEFAKRKDLGVQSQNVPNTKEQAAPVLDKDYSQYTKRSRDQIKKGQNVELQDDKSLVPVGLLRRAASGSVLDYCKRNKIELEKDKDGIHRLKGRSHVTVTDSGFFNEQNKVQGSLVDFVRNHHNMTYVQAVAHITNSPKLLLLEEQYGKVKAHYKSFYVPKDNEPNGQKALGSLGNFLKSQGVSSKVSDKLLLREQAQVTKEGVIRLFPENDSSGCLEFTMDESGKFNRSKKGSFKGVFFSSPTKARKTIVFTDPFTLMQKRDRDIFSKSKTHSILALMEPDSEHVDRFVAHGPNIKSLQVVFSGKSPTRAELDFFNILKKKYEPFGISVQSVPFEKALGKEGPGLSL